MTVSEAKFEAYCSANAIQYSRIATGEGKTPDYEIILEGQRTVVEIKEIRLNADELKAKREMDEIGHASWGTDKFGARIRYKIDGSKRQLETMTAGQHPGILVLYDARPQPFCGISPTEIAVAMYGALTVVFQQPKEMGKPLVFDREKFGEGKKLRRNTHNYISALAVLQEQGPENSLHLYIYHNIYASRPLPLDLLVKRKDMTLYTIDGRKGDQFQNWLHIIE